MFTLGVVCLGAQHDLAALQNLLGAVFSFLINFSEAHSKGLDPL